MLAIITRYMPANGRRAAIVRAISGTQRLDVLEPADVPAAHARSALALARKLGMHGDLDGHALEHMTMVWVPALGTVSAARLIEGTQKAIE